LAQLGFYPKFQAFTSNGNPLSGGTISTYEPGTTTPKTTYSDKTLATPNTNPITLDSRGECHLYFAGLVKLVIKDSAGVTIVTEDNYKGVVGDDVQNQYAVSDYGNNLATALTAIGAANSTLIIDVPVTMAASSTVPATCTLKFNRAGVITTTGHTLTINGPLDAGPWQVFAGSGTVAGLGKCEYVLPQWWGAAVDGTTDDADAIDAALTVADYVSLSGGNWGTSRTISIPQRKRLIGAGYDTNIVALTVSGAVVSITSGNGPTAVKNIRISGTADTGVIVNNAQMLDIDTISLDGLTATNGFIFRSTWGSSFKNLFTNGATISNACFLCGAAFNANKCENWYSSNRGTYGLLIDASYDSGSGISHGSTWSQMTMQSGTYGIYVRNYQGGAFNGVYTEDVVYALRLGDKAENRIARGMCFTGGDYAHPQSSHPNYADREAVIWLDYALGCRIGGVELGGCLNCGNAAPVTITGDGTGATALARVTAAGVVHSVEVACPGSGYSTATATVGGSGSGATLSVTLDTGAVASIAVSDGGTGYTPARCPVAITYHTAYKCVIDGVFLNSGQGDNSSLYPWVVRRSGANVASGVVVVGDSSRRFNSNGNACDVRKTQNYGYKHAVIEWSEAGALVSYVYTPPQYP
jgi:hypothetical protein